VSTGHRDAQVSALDWALSAMGEATRRLEEMPAGDLPRGLAAISEAVWWVTLVDATLVRYHPGDYDLILARHEPDERHAIEDTLGGLRFVRNKMGHDLDPADFARPPGGRPAAQDELLAWVWQTVPEQAGDRGQEWELARHQSFETQLTGRPIGETFTRAAAFLRLVAAVAGVPAEAVGARPS